MAKPVAADGRRNSKTLRFEVAERDVDVRKTGVEDPAPIASTAAGAAAGFGGPLAFDAACGVGQGVEASDRDAFAADLALAVGASLNPNQSPLDIRELAAFDFGQLRADLVLGGIEGGVYDVATGLLAQLLEQAQVTSERLA